MRSYTATTIQAPIGTVTSNSSNVVDFANLLLAKHEANMKQREKEGIGYSLTDAQ